MNSNSALHVALLALPIESAALWLATGGLEATSRGVAGLGEAAGPVITGLAALIGLGIIAALAVWVVPSRAERTETVTAFRARAAQRSRRSYTAEGGETP